MSSLLHANPRLNRTIEDVRLAWGNLMGAEGRFNPQGVRSFGVILPNSQGARLGELGFNVKQIQENLPVADYEAHGHTSLNVKLRSASTYGIIVLDGKKVTQAWQVARLDNAFDSGYSVSGTIEVQGYEWEIGHQRGISAYLVEATLHSFYDPEITGNYLANGDDDLVRPL